MPLFLSASFRGVWEAPETLVGPETSSATLPQLTMSTPGGPDCGEGPELRRSGVQEAPNRRPEAEGGGAQAANQQQSASAGSPVQAQGPYAGSPAQP